MFYILDEWINNPKNETRIRELLNDLYSDLKFEDSLTKDEAIKELKTMKEERIMDVFLN